MKNVSDIKMAALQSMDHHAVLNLQMACVQTFKKSTIWYLNTTILEILNFREQFNA